MAVKRRCLGCGQLLAPTQVCPVCGDRKPPNPRNDPEFRRNKRKVRQRDKVCQGCGHRGSRDNRLEVHHRWPVRYGGDHSLANLVLLCARCHRLADKFAPQGRQAPSRRFDTSRRHATRRAGGA